MTTTHQKTFGPLRLASPEPAEAPTHVNLKARTILAQALGAGDPTTHALTPPVHLSSTYLRDADNGYESGFVYGRTDNATVRQVEAILTRLEGAVDAMLFSSGMAAATAVFLALERPTHIIASEVMYWGFREWLAGVGRYGHSLTFVDTTDLDAVARAVRPGQTGIFWIETPSNPLWTVTDIAAISRIAHAAGALVCVDSTVSTPMLTRPIEFGADIVVHSATKYLNGHSDVIAGAIVVAEESGFWTSIQKVRGHIGSIVGPFEAWLLMRGLRTLDVRMREQSKSAARLAERLSGHPAVAKVLYPGLKNHPGHDIAARQMSGGFGGMLSLRMRGGERAAVEVVSRVEVWQRATSFGGVESLIEHRASIEGIGTPCPSDLLRLSIGLEDPDDLFDDLVRAFG
jgi:cystathionine gamma-synthase